MGVLGQGLFTVRVTQFLLVSLIMLSYFRPYVLSLLRLWYKRPMVTTDWLPAASECDLVALVQSPLNLARLAARRQGEGSDNRRCRNDNLGAKT